MKKGGGWGGGEMTDREIDRERYVLALHIKLLALSFVPGGTECHFNLSASALGQDNVLFCFLFFNGDYL